MRNRHILAPCAAGLIALLLIAPAHGFSLNKSIKIAAGSESGGQSSVNGSISVGKGAIIDGSLETVNGSIRVDDDVSLEDAQTVNGTIRIGAGSSTEDVSSVNGSIRIGQNVNVAGEVEVVNGKISLATGARVEKNVSNVNGEISLSGAEVGGDLSTMNGDVTLSDGAILRGNLTVEKPAGWGWKNNRLPIIIIGQNSKVLGDVVLEREVELFISDSAEVGGVSGELSMDDAVRFSGSRP